MSSTMQTKQLSTEEQFRLAVIPHAELSLATSRIATERATNANAKEFAGFELGEAVAVVSVLKDLKTPVPSVDAKAQAVLDKHETTQGAAFDQAYIEFQLKNHEELRDIAESFLSNSDPETSDKAEQQGRHLATLALATFKEHVAMCKRISGELSRNG